MCTKFQRYVGSKIVLIRPVKQYIYGLILVISAYHKAFKIKAVELGDTYRKDKKYG